MSVYGQNSCTLSTITDVKAIYTYHCLISGTYNPGMAPNDNTSPLNSSDQVKDSITITYNSNTYTWTLTEPGLDITNVDLNKLYYIDCVIFSNNTYDWGPALVSSSYEAAKQAYNKADVASGLVGNMNQHFWSLTSPYSTDVPAGQYITDDSQTNFKGNPNGKSNLLLQSAGISLRYGAVTKAQVTSSGLKVIEGGIEGGSASSGNGYVYLSTIDKSGITINDHAPSTNDPKWRAIIGSRFGVDSEGNLYASNAYIKGEIKADTGSIGGTSGWTIVSQQIYSTGKTIGADDSMFLSTKNLAGTVAGQTLTTTAPSWRLTVGSKFGVDNTGKLYASGATLKIVKLTDANDKERVIIDTNGLTVKDTSGNAVANFGTVASSTSTMTLGQVASGKYNIYLNNSGIKLRYNTTVLNLIDSTGMTLKDSSNSTLAEFKSYINLGTEHTNTYTGSAVIGVGLTTAKTNQVVVGRYNESNSSATFIIGNGTGTAKADRSNLLEVGENAVTIGNSDASHTVLDSNGQRFYATNGSTLLANIGYGDAQSQTGTVEKAPYYTIGTRTPSVPAYDRTKAYGTGDRCIADGHIYTCHTDTPSPAGNLTTAYWTLLSYDDELIGQYSMAEGQWTLSAGGCTHAEGFQSNAGYWATHAEGYRCSAGGERGAHAEGVETTASERGAHAEGIHCIASGRASHAEGSGCIANQPYQHVMGVYNDPKSGDLFEIGYGTAVDARKNVFAVDQNGDVESAGKTTHVCYINSITSTTISATNTVTKIPIGAISDFNDANKYFVYDSSAKGVKIVKDGVYIISVQAGVNPATSGDLMGLNIYRNGSNVIGPEYRRVGGNYDTVILAPTVITLNAGDVLTLYGKNNTAGRGAFTSCRFTIHRI